MRDRAWRRAQRERWRNRIRGWHWLQPGFSHVKSEADLDKMVQMYEKNRAICPCFMCARNRKHDGPPVSELRRMAS